MFQQLKLCTVHKYNNRYVFNKCCHNGENTGAQALVKWVNQTQVLLATSLLSMQTPFYTAQATSDQLPLTRDPS